jgi:hypothetical protein
MRHICHDPRIDAIAEQVRPLNCGLAEALKMKYLREFKRTFDQNPRIKTVEELMEEVKKENIARVKSSNEARFENLDALSISLRKLKFPFRTGVEYFDKHTELIAGQKLEKLLQVIPPEIMARLTNLETPFPFESELPQHPVVSAPELKQVTKKTLNFELGLLPRFILSDLFALLTKTGITPVHTLCDNQRYAGCFKGLCERVQQMTSGEILSNQRTHFAAQHCRNHHGCPSCRALCAMMTIQSRHRKADF